MSHFRFQLGSALILAGATPSLSADIIDRHLYPLGEEGSYVESLPQDTAGASPFLGIGGEPVIATDAPSPASVSYTRFDGAYAYGADWSAVPVDNFAVELWARVADVNHDVGLFAGAKKDDGRLTFHLIGGNWAASYKGVGWIGAGSGEGQAAVVDAWTHLAIIRSAGVSTFYINGVAQVGTLAEPPVFTGNAHLAVLSGAEASYRGDLDHLRIFTFDPQQDDPVAALTLGDPTDGPAFFAGYAVTENGWVDYGDGYYGWSYIHWAPWQYLLALDSWVWLPESHLAPPASWAYFTDAGTLETGASAAGWTFSGALGTWVWLTASPSEALAQWAYVLESTL